MPLSKKKTVIPKYACPRGHKLNDDVPYCMICGESFVRVQPKVKKLGVGMDGWGLVLPDGVPNCSDGRYRDKS